MLWDTLATFQHYPGGRARGSVHAGSDLGDALSSEPSPLPPAGTCALMSLPPGDSLGMISLPWPHTAAITKEHLQRYTHEQHEVPRAGQLAGSCGEWRRRSGHQAPPSPLGAPSCLTAPLSGHPCLSVCRTFGSRAQTTPGTRSSCASSRQRLQRLHSRLRAQTRRSGSRTRQRRLRLQQSRSSSKMQRQRQQRWRSSKMQRRWQRRRRRNYSKMQRRWQRQQRRRNSKMQWRWQRRQPRSSSKTQLLLLLLLQPHSNKQLLVWQSSDSFLSVALARSRQSPPASRRLPASAFILAMLK